MRKSSLLHCIFFSIGMTVLAGCSILGSTSSTPFTIYAPDVRVAPEPTWPQVNWQLNVAKPSAQRMIDSARIVVRPTPGELQVYKGAVWSQPTTDILETSVLRAFEDSDRIVSVGRLNAGIRANYKLVMEIRRFESDYAGREVPSATIEVNAKLLDNADQHVVAARTFLYAEPAASPEIGAVVVAFEQALATITREIVGWTLISGEAAAHAR